MFPGGSRSYLKEWLKEYWIKLINYLTLKNYDAYLTGAPTDREKALEIKKFVMIRIIYLLQQGNIL